MKLEWTIVSLSWRAKDLQNVAPGTPYNLSNFFFSNRTLLFLVCTVYWTCAVNMNFHLCMLCWKRDIGNCSIPYTRTTQNTTSLRGKSDGNYLVCFRSCFPLHSLGAVSAFFDRKSSCYLKRFSASSYPASFGTSIRKCLWSLHRNTHWTVS